MVKSRFMGRDMERLKVEIETTKELQEIVKQALAKEVFEREAEKPAPERKCEPGELEVSIPKAILEGGAQRLETKRGSMNQKGQASSPNTGACRRGRGPYGTLFSPDSFWEPVRWKKGSPIKPREVAER